MQSRDSFASIDLQGCSRCGSALPASVIEDSTAFLKI